MHSIPRNGMLAAICSEISQRIGDLNVKVGNELTFLNRRDCLLIK